MALLAPSRVWLERVDSGSSTLGELASSSVHWNHAADAQARSHIPALYPSSRSRSHMQSVGQAISELFVKAQISDMALHASAPTGQFTVNEWAHEAVNKSMSPETRKNLSAPTNGAITLGCGVVAVRASLPSLAEPS